MSVALFFAGRYTAPNKHSRPAERSLAVLLFENLSEDKANAYLADGMQDEIITRLAKIGELKVISRSSTERYRSKADKVAESAASGSAACTKMFVSTANISDGLP